MKVRQKRVRDSLLADICASGGNPDVVIRGYLRGCRDRYKPCMMLVERRLGNVRVGVNV